MKPNILKSILVWGVRVRDATIKITAYIIAHFGNASINWIQLSVYNTQAEQNNERAILGSPHSCRVAFIM